MSGTRASKAAAPSAAWPPSAASSWPQHERYADGAKRFNVLWVEHEARNNFGAAFNGGPTL
ncbi:hypothetical protein [Massilia sp. Root418]|uniref:hypothetical protein n=1 Tax=Massilia sp. Root418 TaxID=1736532 RepID=UPI000A814C8D|nr:hypothetical protein [Massilia sp. Root418]